MNIVSKLIGVAAIALTPAVTQAAPIDITAAGYTLSTNIFSETGVSGFEDGFGGFTSSSGTVFSFDTFDLNDPGQYAFSLLVGADAADSSFSGASVIGGTATTIEALFEGITATGSFAGFDGGAVLVTYADNLLNLGALYDGTGTVTVSALNEIAVIPLPAALPLLLSGFGSLMVIGRRRRKSA